MKARFITIEGIEGVGKTTSVEFVKRYLNQKNIQFLATREPGGTYIAERIRDVLLKDNNEAIAVDTELLLMFACRAQHIAVKIRPALAVHQWVLSDRFTDASYAYQGGGRGIDETKIRTLEELVQGELQPDLTLLLVAPVEQALARAKNRGLPDRIEKEKAEFFSRVQHAYLRRAEQYPERFRMIDASLKLDQVQENIKRVLDNFLVSISRDA